MKALGVVETSDGVGEETEGKERESQEGETVSPNPIIVFLCRVRGSCQNFNPTNYLLG